MERQMYRKTEYYLYNYYSIKTELKEARENIINAGKREYDISGVGISYHTDPTAMKALKLTSPEMKEKEKWLKVIEVTMKRYMGTRKGKLFEEQYINNSGEKYICNKLDVSRTTYYNWRNEIVNFAMQVAIEENLIKIARILPSSTSGR